MKVKNVLIKSLVTISAVTVFALSALAQVVVTPVDPQGWTTADTRPGGAVSFVVDGTAPGGVGALRLTTDATTTAKAQYMHDAAIPLADVNELKYYTKQTSSSFIGGDASYQLPVCLGGATPTSCTGFTTLVFEPYENGTVVPGVWQQWNVFAGQLWSTRSYTNGTCSVTAGAGGAPFYSLPLLQAACPDAVVVGFGVNIGSNNPSYDVSTDLFDFNGTTYDFEPYAVATSKDQCKNGGWSAFKRADGSSFKNQGDCVSYTNNGK